MGWAQEDWDSYDKKMEQDAKGGGGGMFSAFSKEGETKRYVILDDRPFGFYLHSTYALGGKGFEVCLRQKGAPGSGLEADFGSCPFCEQDDLWRKSKDDEVRQGMDRMWPSFAGFVALLDLGTVTYGADGKPKLTGYVKNNVEYNFSRKFGKFSRGSEKKPGLLIRFREHIAKRGGSLVGCVYDFRRTGKQEDAIGTDWEYVCRIDTSSMDALKASLKKLDGIQPHHHEMIDKMRDESNVAPDWYSLPDFKPKTRAMLLSMYFQKAGYGHGQESSAYGVGGKVPDSTQESSQKAPDDGVDVGDMMDDDSVPF